MKYAKKLCLAVLLVLFISTAPGAQALGAGDMLSPVGRAVAIELETEGVLVAGLATVETEGGCVSPAGEAGLLPGDRIFAVNGQNIAGSDDFINAVRAAGSAPVSLRTERNGKEIDLVVTPARGLDGTCYLGLWLRSSISGIGTVTFHDPASGLFGALGHGVCAGENGGSLLPVKSGAIGSASVAEVVRGQKGVPGELVGVPEDGASIGRVDVNTNAGIFGTASALQGYQTMPVAAADEVVPGEALILSTVSGNTPQTYRVQITRVDRSGEDLRQICLQVTDPHLLGLTGGIVQGMSGSPIIQNGKLVGAVTHVLVEEPTRGYGILMESMLAAAA
ncbi:MAG: PDZ domain-containing protein [Ruminococcaceae bacterium]|nr:PDZ domain-containing protein [Oscillospiraceae bacterium]